MADNPYDYWHDIKLISIGGIISGLIGWVGNVITKTVKKIDDSQSLKAEFEAFKKEVSLELKHIRELMDHDTTRRK